MKHKKIDENVFDEIRTMNNLFNKMRKIQFFIIFFSSSLTLIVSAHLMSYFLSPEYSLLGIILMLLSSVIMIILIVTNFEEYKKLSRLLQVRMTYILLENFYLVDKSDENSNIDNKDKSDEK